MNATNLKSPTPAIDQLVADHGFARVALALLLRIFRRTRPPDVRPRPRHFRRYHLDAHLRRDLGLPPEEPPQTYIDLGYLHRTQFK